MIIKYKQALKCCNFFINMFSDLYRITARYCLVLAVSSLFLVSHASFDVTADNLAVTHHDSATSSDTTTENNSENVIEQDMLASSLLNKMRNAILQSDYQMSLVTQEASQYSSSFKYNQIYYNNQNSATLLYLEGVAKEIILHNDIVSYFQSDSVSFSLVANRIIEAFPDVIYSDFNELANYYDFVFLGKARTANRSSQLIRIVPKDKDRFNYVIWIDDKTNLPLRIDLLDLSSNIIKQVKVISLNLDFDKSEFEDYINNRDYPIIYPIKKESSEFNNWQPTWLPKGFKEKAAYNISFYDSDIDTRLFSDGIFSFTINVSESSANQSEQVVVQGSRTVYLADINNMNIIIIGDLPRETIKKIADNIKAK